MRAQRLPQQIEIDRALGVARKDELATVATLRHMMRHVGDNDSCSARHRASHRCRSQLGERHDQEPLAFRQQVPDNLEAQPSYRREPHPA